MKYVTGACHSGCGACCKTIAFPIVEGVHIRCLTYEGRRLAMIPYDPARARPATYAFWRARGLDIYEDILGVPIEQDSDVVVRPYRGGHRIFVRHRCPQLADDLSCNLHDSPDYPEVCASYPTHWDDLTDLPECSYSIEDHPLNA